MKHIGRRVYEGLDFNKATIQSRVHAAAEVVATSQAQALDTVVSVVQKMVSAGEWRAVAFIDHTLYDETPLWCRLTFQNSTEDTDVQQGKVLVIETSWLMLLQQLGSTYAQLQGTAPGSEVEKPFFTLQGTNSPALRGLGATTGETLASALESLPALPAGLDCFESRTRLVEHDECGANPRCEAFVAKQRGPGWGRLSSLCLAHKCHASASKAWSLAPNLLTSLIHFAKVLNGTGALHSLKRSLGELAATRLQLLARPCEISEALRFKAQLLELFSPPKTQTRRRATISVLSAFFNGDWRVPGRVQHACAGSHCCTSPAVSAQKAAKLVKKMVTVLGARVFSKSNWLDWPLALNLVGLGTGLHGLMQDAFIMTFGKLSAGLTQEVGEGEEVARDVRPILLSVSHATQDRSPHNIAMPEEDALHAANLPTHFHESTPFLHGESAANPVEDEAEIERRRRAASLQVALKFMESPCLEEVRFLRLALGPELRCMHNLVHKVSGDWEKEQLQCSAQGLPRDFRPTALQRDVVESMQASLELLLSNAAWEAYPCTEEFRSRQLKMVMRVCSCHFPIDACTSSRLSLQTFWATQGSFPRAIAESGC